MVVSVPTAVSALPAPTADQMLVGSLIVVLSRGKPRRMQKLMGEMRTVIRSRAALGGAVRIRAARFDADTQESLRQALAWLDAVEPVMQHLRLKD